MYVYIQIVLYRQADSILDIEKIKNIYIYDRYKNIYIYSATRDLIKVSVPPHEFLIFPGAVTVPSLVLGCSWGFRSRLQKSSLQHSMTKVVFIESLVMQKISGSGWDDDSCLCTHLQAHFFVIFFNSSKYEIFVFFFFFQYKHAPGVSAVTHLAYILVKNKIYISSLSLKNNQSELSLVRLSYIYATRYKYTCDIVLLGRGLFV